ncbi:hypothetical protein FF041_17045 [Streptomyces jumonjinensis]|uniref:Uncharacterized protein n=1 Tax=Streptomyces jumonjinensis TaxID=1945 RepID=A0A646KI21_STRJU|nr:hypothetical protein [Streptomyces jumonjinensis]
MDQAGSGSGVWCRASQGGGGSHCGALATDDNAARCGARAREPSKIHRPGPEAREPAAAERTARTASTVLAPRARRQCP